MFKYNPNSDEYAMLDLDQANKKVIMNAEYGGSGAPTAAFSSSSILGSIRFIVSIVDMIKSFFIAINLIFLSNF